MKVMYGKKKQVRCWEGESEDNIIKDRLTQQFLYFDSF